MAVFSMLTEILSVAFVGHLGDPAKVAGVGLATTYVNMVGQSLIIGMNGGVGTYVS
jgi:Na+-driven multidrug efflux pump